MSGSKYSERLRVLLTLGCPRVMGVDGEEEVEGGTGEAGGFDEWRDYGVLGLTEADGPELIRMATDKQLGNGPEPACFGPLHAWRALGELRYEPAAGPLVDYLDALAKADDEWGLEDMPRVLAKIGAPAVPALQRALPDQRRNMWARAAMGHALELIAKADPSCRGEAVEAITGALRLGRHNDPGLNGLLVGNLIELRATESVRVIQDVHEAGLVDEEICGDLSEVLRDLGLRGFTLDVPEGADPAMVDEVIREYNAERERAGRPERPMTEEEQQEMERALTERIEQRVKAAGRGTSGAPHHGG